MRPDGISAAVVVHHLAGDLDQFFAGGRLGDKANASFAVVFGVFAAIAEDENRDLGLSGVEFGDKGRPPNTWPMMARDNQTQPAGKGRLFNQAKGLGSICNANHIAEAFFKCRHPYEGL